MSPGNQEQLEVSVVRNIQYQLPVKILIVILSAHVFGVS